MTEPSSPIAFARTCKACPLTIGPRNKSGYCRTCVRTAPETRAKTSASLKLKLVTDPAYRDRLREAGRLSGATEMQKLKRSLMARERRFGELGKRHFDEDTLRKRAAAVSRTKTAWCPDPALLPLYRHLVGPMRMKADEARPMILEQHELNQQRIRRELQDVANLADNRAAERERVQHEFARQAAEPALPRDVAA